MFLDGELDITRYVQQMRTPLWDEFFKFLNYFDRSEFFLLLIPLIWFAFNWKWGVKFFYLLLLNAYVNYFIKMAFAHPRPFQIDPTVGIIQVSGYGFPSGAAQTAVLLPGLLLYFWKSRWKWLVAISYFSLISLSRVYLGVHFISDVIGGWIVGLSLLAILYASRSFVQQIENLKPKTLFIAGLCIPLLLLALRPSALPFIASALGISFGLFLSRRWELLLQDTAKIKERSYRACIGICGTLVFHYLPYEFLSENDLLVLFLRFFFIGLYLSLLGNIACKPLSQKFSEAR